ncbi:MAG: MFS transporter [Acidimicrobiia bacterium]
MSAITRTDSDQVKSAVMGMIVISSALVLVALPFFMVGGLAVQIKEELGLTEAALGAAVTIGFVTGALTAPLGGRVADHFGPRRSVYLGCVLCAVTLLGLGLVVDGWGVMVGFLCLGGVAVALTDPGLAILVSRSIPDEVQGLAFGVKEASIPAATLVAGIAVPTVALTVGWRWAFAFGLLPLVAVFVLLPRLEVGPKRSEPAAARGTSKKASPHRNAVLLVAVAAALGTTAASGVGIFLTDSAVAMGMSPGNAGLLLAFGSIAGIIARVSTGILADRTGGPQFKLISLMLAGGALTIALGSTGNTWLLIVATVGAFTGGWAWTGIYFLSLVKTNPDRPGAVAGIGTAGLGVGNAAGPVLFGVVAGSVSFGAAWIGAAIVAALAAGLMAAARKMF